MQKALIIFIKNPALGKVKTRLATTVGDKAALKVYQFLLSHTMEITYELDTVDKFLFYSEFIPTKDEWPPSIYQKEIQNGEGLGNKMKNAFGKIFDENYKKAVLMMPDCPKMTDTMLDKAFKMLDTMDMVVGPTQDGGYYLLGMKKLHEELFDGIEYSQPNTCAETIAQAEKLGLKVFKLPTLVDIDMEEDLGKLKKMIDEPKGKKLEL